MKITVPRSKLDIRYSRSGGPGGQNVNKVETRVEARLKIADLDVLQSVRDRIAARLAGRLNAQGEVTVASSRHRLRSHNLNDCLDRLEALLSDAATPEVPRFATRPTRGSEQRRRKDKARHGLRKRERGSRPDED